MPLEFFSLIQALSVELAALLVLFSVRHLWRRRLQRLSALCLTILLTVLMNALVTRTLSMVENRFQARVIWLVPFAAAVLLLEKADQFIPSLKSSFIRRREVESLVSSN
jgi:drug/metabolite transporter (DMT)-like permease